MSYEALVHEGHWGKAPYINSRQYLDQNILAHIHWFNRYHFDYAMMGRAATLRSDDSIVEQRLLLAGSSAAREPLAHAIASDGWLFDGPPSSDLII